MIAANESSVPEITSRPKVVIGVPVFNEIKFIKTSLESLIGLEYENLEILVSDNGSNDGTSEVIRGFALKDERIKHVIHEVNSGAQENFQFCLNNSDCDYFMWGSGHDLWGKDLIAKCVDYLERDARCVLAYGTTTCIDGNGDFSKAREFPSYDTQGLNNAVARMHFVLWGSMNPILGVFRKSALTNTMLGNVIGGDLLFLLDLSVKGTFKLVPSGRFYRREVRAVESHAERMKRYRDGNFKLYQNAIGKSMPILSLGWLVLKFIVSSNLRWHEKALALISFVFSFPAKLLAGKNGH